MVPHHAGLNPGAAVEERDGAEYDGDPPRLVHAVVPAMRRGDQPIGTH